MKKENIFNCLGGVSCAIAGLPKEQWGDSKQSL